MTEAECRMVEEGQRWRRHVAEKEAFRKEQILRAERALEKPCPLCEKKRLERVRREEEERRRYYESLPKGQRILARIRGDYRGN